MKAYELYLSGRRFLQTQPPVSTPGRAIRFTKTDFKLSPKDRHELMRLLGELQTHLESAIESSLTPDGNAMPEDAATVEDDRKLWKLAEKWVKRLEMAK